MATETALPPMHLRPSSCYVCGAAEHPDVTHKFWSNAAANAYFAAEDARRTVRYSSGATTPEAHYVATVRPY